MIRLQEKFVSASIIIFVHAPIILILTNSQKNIAGETGYGCATFFDQK